MNETRINATKTGFEMNVMVNGVYEWREAEWLVREVVGFCDKRGIQKDTVPYLRPIIRRGECVQTLKDGTWFITPRQTDPIDA